VDPLLESYTFLVVYVVVTLVVATVLARVIVRIMAKLALYHNVSRTLAEFLGTLLRATIWLVAAIAVIAEVSITFGLQGTIANAISSFLAENAGRLGVMSVIVVGGYVAVRIFGILFAEYRRHSKMHPLTLDLFQSGIRYFVYTIVAVLLLTNVLVMAGLQTLAGTLVTLFTVFIGLVVSFSATGSIGNALAGIVLMSWRPYKEGDRVEVGSVYGDIAEVDVMFTQVRTIKNEVVYVPNSQVLSSKIVNYSLMPQVIAHYEVTIGYDIPHSKVENLLIDSARKTLGLLAEPQPFVLIRNLDNNFVAYEINAYTDKPNELTTIYSRLMQNILETFEAAHVEILSPQHFAIRDSRPTTNPE
jgi:small-conductance mechanosensitive channel